MTRGSTLYLMRHGIAAEPSKTTSDADRALTADGVRKTTRVAVGLQRMGLEPDLILSSPLRRAEETARLVAETLAPSVSVELYPPLAGGATPEAVLKGLRASRGARQVILVGHQPDLGDVGVLPADRLANPRAAAVPQGGRRRDLGGNDPAQDRRRPGVVSHPQPATRHRRRTRVSRPRRPPPPASPRIITDPSPPRHRPPTPPR